jgi:hypothetical protein
MARLASPLIAGVVATLLAAAPSSTAPGAVAPGLEPAQVTTAAPVRGEVFVGGYFYDPAFGAYPWWPRGHYPYVYEPNYGARAILRLGVMPNDAAVYVDGFYAGLTDDFDGALQGLPLPPGSHAVFLHRPGYKSQRHHVYLRPESTLAFAVALDRLGPGERADLRPAVLRVPAPAPGSYRLPVVRWGGLLTAGPEARPLGTAIGSLDLRTQPASAVVAIDGEPWWTSDPGHFAADLVVGTHRVHVAAPGFQAVELVVEIEQGARKPASVRLVPAT